MGKIRQKNNIGISLELITTEFSKREPQCVCNPDIRRKGIFFGEASMWRCCCIHGAAGGIVGMIVMFAQWIVQLG